jgi:trimeric autotransporter adhesin
MKNIFITLTLLLFTFYALSATLPPALTLAPLITNSFCTGSSAYIGFSADTYPPGHTYAVQLSDSNGSFSGTPTVLGTGQSSPIDFILPTYSSNTTTNYRLRIIDQNDISRVSGSSPTIYFGTLSIKLQTVSGESSSTRICNGSSVKLYANVNFPDNNGFTYYWYKDGSSLPAGGSNSYTTNQTGVYQVRVQRYGCDGYTSTNTFDISNVSNFNGEFFKYKNNFSPYQCTGTTLDFKSVYEAENATYQWQKDGVVIQGQTKSILNVTQSGAYTLTVNDANCSAPSSYTLTRELTFSNVIHPLINVIPSNVINDSISYCANYQNVSLQHNNSFSNSSSYSYQWKKNGIDINGANQYEINYVPEGIYSLKIMQGSCSTMSKGITVIRKTTSSKIIKSYGTKACVGDQILVFIDGLACSSYQWQRDGIDIPMATFTNIYATQSGNYRVKILENGITHFSNSIDINISDVQPFVISEINPNFKDCTNSKSYYLSDPDAYAGSLYNQGSFQWYKDDIIISGATRPNYTITNSGVYKLRVTKGSCTGFSQNQTVTIPNTNPEMSKPQISSNNGFVICNGGYTNLQAWYFSNANYEWKRNGQTILNGLMKYSLDIIQSGNYTVTVTKSPCIATSDPFTINIGDKQQSIKNSNWNDATMWSCGTVPTISEDALINKGHTISIPNNYTGFVKDLQLNGILQYGNNALLKSRTN